MKKLLAGSCVFVFLVLTCELLLNLPGAHGQNVFLNPSNFSAFSQIPISRQRPSTAGMAGVATATVAFAVFSCSFVFLLGLYEELCHRNTYTNSKAPKKRSAAVGSRYGGSRYRPPKTRLGETSA